MTAEELKDIALCGETTNVQFKQEFTGQKEIAKEMVAFANTRGGGIFFGIKDKTGELIGLSYDEIQTISRELGNTANEQVRPTIYIETDEFKAVIWKKVSGVIEDVSEKVSEKHIKVFEKVLERVNANGDSLTENRKSIIKMMIENPYVTRPEIAEALHISIKSVGTNIEVMRGKYLKRVGPDKGGHWEIITDKL